MLTEPAGVLYVDPPWSFGDGLPGPGRGAVKHYPTMSLAQLCMFELPALRDDCLLALWRVGAMQREAIVLAQAWGFRDPVAEFVWAKTRGETSPTRNVAMGMGRRVRNAHEVLLLCERGRPVCKRHDVLSIQYAPRGRHSEKPELFAELLASMYDGPYVELFARRKRDGWTTLGNDEALR
jgi:N6-adenosine-specific RNA methylase IME4